VRNAALPDYADVTLEDLFLCKGGIAAYISDEEKFPDINPTSPHPRLAFARYLLAQPPAATRDAAGKFEHVYSNAGYTLISLMLEQASGLTWEDSVAQLSTALGLEMRVGWPTDHGADQPWGHGQDSEGQPKVFAPDDPYRLSTLIAPAGDIAMRPLDYARYVQLHAQGLAGTDNYLRAATYRHIHLGHQGFSLGVGNGKYVGKLVSQFDGSAGTFYCHSIIVHGADLAYVVLANAGTPHAVSAIYGLSAAILKQRFGKWWKFWV
jgi:CubicO group peptidase (beta-lactamase class C family)